MLRFLVMLAVVFDLRAFADSELDLKEVLESSSGHTCEEILTNSPADSVSPAEHDQLVLGSLLKLKRFAKRLAREDSLAEDLVSTVVVKLLENRGACKSRDLFFPWARMIMFNQFKDDYRKRQKMRPIDIDAVVDEVEKMLWTHGDQESAVSSGDFLSRFNQLNKARQDDLIALEVHGETYEHLAARTNRNIGTLKSQVSRARQSLQQKLLIQCK